MLTVCRHADAREFLTRAEAWLTSSPIEHAVALASARNARANDSYYQRPLYWATIEDESQIVGCAFRTPPYRLGVTALPAAAIPVLLADVAALYSTLSGVAGTEPAASSFADAWTREHGGSWKVQSSQRLFALRSLELPGAQPAGRLRLANDADAALAQDWGAAHARDSGIAPLDGRFCLSLIRERRLHFWDDGRPRCMVGVFREAPGAAAIGIVYTPAGLRKRGYATAAVSALSRHYLDRSTRGVFVCADPKNAAAHALCRQLGFESFQDSVDIDFD
jgi:RimJ/RimL family protein N-acetyltransferase